MQLPLRVNRRDLPPFPSLDAEIRRQTTALERLMQDFVRCEVTLASAAHHGLPGLGYVVDVDVRDADGRLLVRAQQGHDELDRALTLAFGAAARALVGRCHAVTSGTGRRFVASPQLPVRAELASASKSMH